jgi:large subunit ribosomal protein L2
MKVIKPINSSRRFLKQSGFKNTFLNGVFVDKKKLKTKLKGLFGRGSNGTITVRHKGGGHKKQYRSVDFKRRVNEVKGVVCSIEYDPNRNCNLSLIHYPSIKTYKYILSPDNLKLGSTVVNYAGKPDNYSFGSSCKLKYIPIGLYIHSLESIPGGGASVVRSAGLKTFIVGFYKKKERAIIKLPSGEIKYFSYNCKASFGTVGNKEFFNTCLGKAGRSR